MLYDYVYIEKYVQVFCRVILKVIAIIPAVYMKSFYSKKIPHYFSASHS